MSAVIYIGASADSLRAAPLPESITVTLADIGARRRTVAGYDAGGSCRRGVRTLRISWKNPYNAAELLSLLSLERFCLRYPDPVDGGFRTAEFFSTRRQADISYAADGVPVIDTLNAVCEEV